jgi:glycosyltransferase involved in cell wall biosynthesis
VILPTYNRLRTLPRAVASVLDQDEPDFELLIVDDASTDATASWLRTLTDPRIRVIGCETNGGPSAARNRGLEAAQAPIAAFLDSDDVYRPNRLRVALGAFRRESDVVCTLSSAMKQVRTRQDLALLPDVRLESAAFSWALFCDLVGVETTSITVRTAAARSAGGFCEGLRRTEDREFLIRLAPFGAVRLLSEVLWEKSWMDDSLSNDWTGAGSDLVRYVAQRPEYVNQFRRLGSYLASKVLVADLRRHDLSAVLKDWRQFRRAGLLGSVAQTVRAHRQVRKYRRRIAREHGLATLTGPPRDWS